MKQAKATPKTREQLRESAEKLLKLGEKKFGVPLDFSEESLVLADDLITLFFKLHKQHYYTASTFIGAYLGEVIIENLGGRWMADLSLGKVGNLNGIAYPMQRARKRLRDGMEESLVHYYRSLKLSTCREARFAEDLNAIQEAYRALREQGWHTSLLLRILNPDEKKYVREEAAELLSRLGNQEVVDSLVEALRTGDDAYFAAISLQGIPSPAALEPLTALIRKARSPGTVMQAALALGNLKDPRAVPILLPLLDDENELVAHYAALALGKTGCSQAVEPLLQVLRDGGPGRRINAITALEGLGTRQAVPAIIEALFARDNEVREAAARALQFIPDERAWKPLSYLLKDPSYRIRILSAYALAYINPDQALPVLRRMLRDEVQMVRHHASQLLYWLEKGNEPAVRCV